MYTNEELNKLSKLAHQNAVDKGFYDNPLTHETLCLLVITELSEAYEAYRKKGLSLDCLDNFENTMKDLSDSEFDKWFKFYVKDTFGDEMADTVIRLLDMAGYYDVDFGGSFVGKIHKKNEIDKKFKEKTIESIIMILTDLISECSKIKKLTKEYVQAVIITIFIICEKENIDLKKHIKYKMRYNAGRERLHGKRF